MVEEEDSYTPTNERNSPNESIGYLIAKGDYICAKGAAYEHN
jgi:hypothetical protein